MSRPRVRVRRGYEPPAPEGGARVLVDRVWPRGLRKDAAGLDERCQQVAPSTRLRQWYGPDPETVPEVVRRYRAELAEPERAAEVARLRELARERTLTLLTATKEPDLSQAAVLAELLTTG